MAIQRLEIHGYRSFEDTIWEPGKLNLLVGPNGSGKSNLLRLLQLISNTARGKLLESIDKAGGMVSQLWNQEATSLGWDLTIDPLAQTGELSRIPITFSVDVKQQGTGSGYYLAEDVLWLRSDADALRPALPSGETTEAFGLSVASPNILPATYAARSLI